VFRCSGWLCVWLQPGHVRPDFNDDLVHPSRTHLGSSQLVRAVLTCLQMEPWYSAGGSTGTTRGLLTAVLELGAWVGTLVNGILADSLGRRWTVVVACVVFTVGVIVQALLKNYAYIIAGRFVTGIGVGAFSMLVPLYNAELAPPEVRGALVALQQLAITFGIMVSYFIGYGTNFLGGFGAPEDLRDASWLIPICIQLVPSTILAVGMIAFMPQSPRHLINQGREEECLQVLARLRSTNKDDIRVRIEFLEIKALREFEKQRSIELFPHLQDGSFKSNFLIGWNDYKSLFTNRSILKRTMVAILTMVFQQWNGINAILYYVSTFCELSVSVRWNVN
jgi:MFS family permease